MDERKRFREARQGDNGGPPLDDERIDDDKRIDERLQRAKHQWRRDMEHLTQIELNEHWQNAVADLRDHGQRNRLAAIRLSPAQCNALKLLYGRPCDHMSADLNNDPREAWPKQTDLAKALGWSERTVRTYKQMLEVLGLIYTHRTKRLPRQTVTRNHYKLMPPQLAATGDREQPATSLPVATGNQLAAQERSEEDTGKSLSGE